MALVKIYKDDFHPYERMIIKQNDLEVITKKYPTEIESLIIKNARGYVEILPYMGQIIWDVVFDGKSLKLSNIFDMPRPAKTIIDTYGCFAFHSGLLANGCPASDDTHPMHGEFSVARMDEVVLYVDEHSIKVESALNFCQGFGFHYEAKPSVTVYENSSFIDIAMNVKNLTHAPMPLQYMCHMNYAYFDNAQISSNVPDAAFKLRESIPSHVHPTQNWLAYNEKLKELQLQGKTLTTLNEPAMYDPEIVFMADNLREFTAKAVFEMRTEDGAVAFSEFNTEEFPSATRWIMFNEDLKVGAFVLPATCRPEGFNAAKKAGTLIYLATNESRSFNVRTGLRG